MRCEWVGGWDVGCGMVPGEHVGSGGSGGLKSQGKKGQTNELSYDDAWRFPYKILSATKRDWCTETGFHSNL